MYPREGEVEKPFKMGAEAETNKQFMEAGVLPPVASGKVSDKAEKAKFSVGFDAASKPTGRGGRKPTTDRGLKDDEIGATLAAASEKLQAAHRRDQNKQKKGVAGCFSTFNLKRLFRRFRDVYINTCVMAAEKGDFVDLVAGHHAYYGETVMSRNNSHLREHEEILNASLGRQLSISLSRQLSQNGQSLPGPFLMTRNTSNGIPGMHRSASTGIPGLHRNLSTGISGLPRQTSTTGIAGLNSQPSQGIAEFRRHTGVGRSTFWWSSSNKQVESNLFAGGAAKFLEERASHSSWPTAGPDKVNQKK